MRSLSKPNIESELSYAYLHAVASRAGMACREGNRHHDANGIDATITAWLPYVDEETLTEVDLNVQLKATIAEPRSKDDDFVYRLKGLNRYNDLRAETVSLPRVIVVLFLPSDANTWLHHSPDQLLLRQCAYWQSLRGAPEIATDSTNVRLPKAHVFSPASLTDLATRLSRHDVPRYHLT